VDAERDAKILGLLEDAREAYHEAASSKGDASDAALIKADRLLLEARGLARASASHRCDASAGIVDTLVRLRAHRTYDEIVRRKLRELARFLEELEVMALDHAIGATDGALGSDGPPTPEFTRAETWKDRVVLLERSAALGAVASAHRCVLKLVAREG
jgi:hypothetical protein